MLQETEEEIWEFLFLWVGDDCLVSLTHGGLALLSNTPVEPGGRLSRPYQAKMAHEI